MSNQFPRLGMVFDREFPADAIADYARSVDDAGLDELWIIEDCFFTAGISLAATALAVTDGLTVGLGVLPAVARNPAITAMEIATLCNLAPRRLVPGIGHGVQSWMQQMGARTPSPLTTLDETITVITRLLAGEEVTFDGRQLHLDAVRLDQPPGAPPPVLAGVQQEKSLALAGRVAGGVVLVEGAGPTYVEWALDQAGRPDDFEVATFTMLSVADDRRTAYEPLVEFVAGLARERRPAFRVLPFADDLFARVERDGAAALLDMPADHWREIGAIGTLDDARAHLESLAASGVTRANVFPGPSLDIARAQMATLTSLR